MERSEIDPFREENASWLSPSAWIPRFPPQCWLKTSHHTLVQAEQNILKGIWNLMEHKFVPIQNGTKYINTVIMNKNSSRIPLVMIHGMGSGVGLFVLNYEALGKNRPLYAFDVMGFGRSSRPKFSKDTDEAEAEFIQSIEEWRKEMNLEKFVLLGHSLGGFLASSYAIKYPERIRHLILADPWGFPEKPTDQNGRLPIPWYIKGIARIISPFNPLAGLRVLGPWGPSLISKVRSDIVQKFAHLYTDDTVGEYIYHCNAQPPSGEVAFKTISTSFGWAKNPMINRIESLAPHVPITMLYGSRSWMDSSMGYQVKFLRHNSYVDVQVVKGAGHHVYADCASQFNSSVNRVCLLVDQQFDMATQSPVGAYKRLRRASENNMALSGAFASRRRIQSECPPDSAEGSEFFMRQSQSFAGIKKQAITEESPEKESKPDTIEESDPLISQETSNVVFNLHTDTDELYSDEGENKI